MRVLRRASTPEKERRVSAAAARLAPPLLHSSRKPTTVEASTPAVRLDRRGNERPFASGLRVRYALGSRSWKMLFVPDDAAVDGVNAMFDLGKTVSLAR